MLAFLYSANKIGAEGACSLAESLKQNTALTELNLMGMLGMYELLIVGAR